MKHHDSILAVDAGNSRVKWAFHDGVRFSQAGVFTHTDRLALDRDWSQLSAPDAIVIANVAGSAVGARLHRGCARWSKTPIWAAGTKSQCGVNNRYVNPGQLGPDRWAALVGAKALAIGNCIVVCMGTATTIDALTDQGDFLGGMILPGIDMMHASLSENTARLGSERGKSVPFPRSTANAITSGAVRSTSGAIGYMHAEMRKAGHRDVSIVATGGAASAFSALYSPVVQLHEKLVLEGLVCIGRSRSDVDEGFPGTK